MSRLVRGISHFYYRSVNSFDEDSIFSVESIGVDYPCPVYYVERTRSKNDTKSIYVFEYVISGKGYIESEGKTYAVGAGDFYYLNRVSSHKYYPDEDDPYKKIWINARGRLLDGLVTAYGMSSPVIVCHDESIYTKFQEFAELFSTINLENHDTVMTMGEKKICDLIISVYKARHDANERNRNTAQKIKDYIDSGINYNVSLEDISIHFFLNKSYIISAFSERYGKTPKQYILQRKITAACSLLRDNFYSIYDIADMLNFSSSQHFSTVFKKFVGKTPDTYRKLAHEISDGTENIDVYTELMNLSEEIAAKFLKNRKENAKSGRPMKKRGRPPKKKAEDTENEKSAEAAEPQADEAAERQTAKE